MATATIVALSEYLDTSYRPDREYIDGEILERNVGESDHSRLQALLIGYLVNRESQWGIVVMPEQRVQVKSTRYRVPDITVVAGPLPPTPILHEPPFLCIEILSRGDSVYEMQDRIDDYLTFGVPHVWVLNPRTRRAFLYTPDGMREPKDGILRTQNPDIEVPIADLG
jgi:Uma2 family endonuclease